MREVRDGLEDRLPKVEHLKSDKRIHSLNFACALDITLNRNPPNCHGLGVSFLCWLAALFNRFFMVAPR